MHLVREHKPENGASPNALAVSLYQPSKPVSFEKAKEQLLQELSVAPWTGVPQTPVYAFVTGTIRQHWEEASDSEKKKLDEEMFQFFKDTNVKPLISTSFFLPQDEEGNFELRGTRGMYGNLVSAGLLEKGTSVVGSFGIGRGSCQWTVLSKTGQPLLIGHKAGMTNLPKLKEVTDTVMGEYKNPESLELFLDALETSDKPVIALKSGAVLALEAFPNLKAQLKASEANKSARDENKEPRLAASSHSSCLSSSSSSSSSPSSLVFFSSCLVLSLGYFFRRRIWLIIPVLFILRGFFRR